MDNISQMNATSWKLFDLISSQPNLLIITMCIRTTAKYFQPVEMHTEVSSFQFMVKEDSEVINYYKKYLKPRECDIFNIADMSPISKASFKKAMISLSPVYERDINE